MTKITVGQDCGNAPKRQFIVELLSAFARNDQQCVLDSLTDDVRWEIVGRESFEGKEAVSQMLAARRGAAEELIVENVLSHGAHCSANGVLIAETRVAFCAVYAFNSHGKNARIKSVQVYEIQL